MRIEKVGFLVCCFMHPTLYVHIIAKGKTCQALMLNSTEQRGGFLLKKLDFLKVCMLRSKSRRLVRAKRGLHSSAFLSPRSLLAVSPLKEEITEMNDLTQKILGKLNMNTNRAERGYRLYVCICMDMV